MNIKGESVKNFDSNFHTSAWNWKFKNFGLIHPFLNHFEFVEIDKMAIEMSFIYQRIVIMHQNKLFLDVQAIFIKVFVASKCFEGEISIWINEITNDKIIEFIHFLLQFNSPLCRSSNNRYLNIDMSTLNSEKFQIFIFKPEMSFLRENHKNDN